MVIFLTILKEISRWLCGDRDVEVRCSDRMRWFCDDLVVLSMNADNSYDVGHWSSRPPCLEPELRIICLPHQPQARLWASLIQRCYWDFFENLNFLGISSNENIKKLKFCRKYHRNEDKPWEFQPADILKLKIIHSSPNEWQRCFNQTTINWPSRYE